ncbi:MAG: TlpA family protein disulfide reductase [Gemmataceae bacterium]|nr:TlpA family protein disulfide reductase [Gemmataceae bacterium]
MRFLIVALILCLGWQPAWAGEDIKDGAKLEGKLSKEDPADKVIKRSPHKVHKHKMEAGGVYIIEMSSKQFDTFLRLEDAKGKNLAMNDDADPSTLNSRIVFKAPAGGSYHIIATSYDGKVGDYTLSVRKGTDEDVAKADPFHDMIGKSAPEVIIAQSVIGDTKRLSDLKGKVVLVDFWAVWCGPCIQTFPHLRDWTKEFGKDGFEIVGVTTYFEVFGFDKEGGKLKRVGKEESLKPAQEHDMIKDFAGFHQLGHRLVTVTKEDWKKLGEDYKIRGIPHAVLIDRRGNVRMVRVGSGPENAAALHEEIRKLVAEK